MNPLCDNGHNILQQDDTTQIEVEDIIVGCIRSFDNVSKQAIVNHVKVVKVLKELDEISVSAIQGCLRCSKAQASRYMAVITLASPFLARWVSRGAKVRGYIEVTPEAVKAGVWLNKRFINPTEFKRISK